MGGVNWVFHDPTVGTVRHVNVLYVHSIAQMSVNQSASQPIATNGMVLYQQPPNQIVQHTQQAASANRSMNLAPQQMVSALQPTILVPPQQMPIANQQIDWSSKIAEVIREQFGLRPKQQSAMYRTPYPLAYDQLPFPHKYKAPDFTKFSGQGDVSTVKHVNRFILQCGEVVNQDALKVWLFSMSLSGSAFTWFTTLPANSILYWVDLEKQFHQFFYSGTCEMKLTDLTGLR
jgi:hypothetical protein